MLRFASQNNTNVLVNHYLGSISTINGAANYLQMQRRTDLAEHFRSATMKWNPNLLQSLPKKELQNVQNDPKYKAIIDRIREINPQIEATTSEAVRAQLKLQRHAAYEERRAIEKKRLKEIQAAQKIVYDTNENPHEQCDWRRTHFDRFKHMLPKERIRLAENMTQRALPRSPEWVSALKDLIALRTNNEPRP